MIYSEVITSPVILTDLLFSQYGGHTINTTNAQRQAAYYMAEQQVAEDLETFLLPTIVTGSYLFEHNRRFLILDHTYVRRVIKTSFLDIEEDVYWSQLGTANIYISLRDPERGLVDIHSVVGNCNCASHNGYFYPYKVEEVYEAGLSSGTTYRGDIMLALTTYADIILNEIIGYGNESPGDIGVQSFRNQQYSEERYKLVSTSFGTSARAQFIKKQLEKHRRLRHVGLGY